MNEQTPRDMPNLFGPNLLASSGPTGELEIRRVIRPTGGSAYVAANGFRFAPSQITGAAEFLRELEALTKGGARAILVKLDCAGGDVEASFAIYNALRATSAAGVPVVAFLRGWNGSSSPWIALAADLVMIHPDAQLAIHSSEAFDLDPEVRERRRLAENARILRIFEERSHVERGWIEAALAGRFDPVAKVYGGAVVKAPEAVGRGLADEIGEEASARNLAGFLASGGRLLTRRVSLQDPHPRHARDEAENLYPNPTSEITPPNGADPGAPAWFGLYNAGAGAFAGSWVRRLVTLNAAAGGVQYQEFPPMSIPIVAGERFYLEFELIKKVDATAGIGGYAYCRFYNAAGAWISTAHDALASGKPAAWTKYSVTTDPAPAGAVTAKVGLGIDATASIVAGLEYWYDAILWRRMTGTDVLVDYSVISAKLAVDALATTNYDEDLSGNPTHGAKLDHTGTALKVAPGNLQLGSYFLDASVRILAAGQIHGTSGVYGHSSINSGITGITRLDQGSGYSPRYVLRIACDADHVGSWLVGPGASTVGGTVPTSCNPIFPIVMAAGATPYIALVYPGTAWEDPDALNDFSFNYIIYKAW